MTAKKSKKRPQKKPLASKSVQQNCVEDVVKGLCEKVLVVKLDRSIVKNYLKLQTNGVSDMDQNVSVISIKSDDENPNDSVVFVHEEKPPNISPKSQIEQLQRENANQRHRINKLETHVQALQKTILNNGNEEQVDGVIKNTSTLNMSFNESWLNNQIADLCNEDNITLLSSEIEKYMN